MDNKLQQRFNELKHIWQKETLKSNDAEMFSHIAYLKIISMGKKAVPMIMNELENGVDQWFKALMAITDQNPCLEYIAKNSNVKPGKFNLDVTIIPLTIRRDVWLKWWEENKDEYLNKGVN